MLGANLEHVMREKGLSARDVAAKAKVGRKTVDRIRSGARPPILDTIAAIADAIDVSLFELFIDRGRHMLHGSEQPQASKAEIPVSFAKRTSRLRDKTPGKS